MVIMGLRQWEQRPCRIAADPIGASGKARAQVMAMSRWWSAALCVFLAITAIPGAIGLWSGAIIPSSTLLAGSPFSSYAVPAAALLAVGLLAAVAARALITDDSRATAFSALAGVALVVFELVEVAVIGSPTGPARWMQAFFLALGTALTVFAVLTESRR